MRNYFILSVSAAIIAATIISCQDANRIQYDMYYTNGRDLYISHCQNCHGAKGEGLAALAPPLTDTTYLKENRTKIACFIKNGLTDTIFVNSNKYDGKMPAENFANIDIAQIIVYVTNTFGNKHGNYSQEQVATDLSNCK
ncbi:mono/diheme cytochrome c family protein [Pedobacter sp. UYP24]